MLTTIQPRKKEHLTNVSSPLKTFYDNLRGPGDNLNILDFWNFWYATWAKVHINAQVAYQKFQKSKKFKLSLYDRVSGRKTLLGAN